MSNFINLIILDYSDKSVHQYKVPKDTNIDEEYINFLGHHPSNCSWMFSKDMILVKHI